MQFWIWVVLKNPHEPKAHKIQLTTCMIMYHHHLFFDIARNAATAKRHRKPEIFTSRKCLQSLATSQITSIFRILQGSRLQIQIVARKPAVISCLKFIGDFM